MKVFLIRNTKTTFIPLYWSEDRVQYVSKGDADWYYESETVNRKLPENGQWEEYFVNH